MMKNTPETTENNMVMVTNDLETGALRRQGDWNEKDGRPVLVTTAHRGVFFGYAADTTGDTIFLQNGQMVVYWSEAMKGFMGLATTGPDDKCRIGPPVNITLRDITAVVEVSTAAAQKFQAAPWRL